MVNRLFFQKYLTTFLSVFAIFTSISIAHAELIRYDFKAIGLIKSNEAPVTVGDLVGPVYLGGAIRFTVTDNDVDNDGNLNLGSVKVISGPYAGTATVDSSGIFTYTQTDPSGPDFDQLTYTVADTEGAISRETTITIKVIQSTFSDESVTKLLAKNVTEKDGFGKSVSISGNTAVITAIGDSPHTGAAYVFVRDGIGGWIQQAKLIAVNDTEEDGFGTSASISGDTVVIGAFLDGDNGVNSGSAYIFVRDENGIWSQQAKLVADDGDSNDLFGASVSIFDNTVVIGAIWDNNETTNSSPFGSAYIFVRDEVGHWNQQTKLTPDDVSTQSSFGKSVSISGDAVIIGTLSSSAYVFIQDENGGWNQQNKLVADNNGSENNLFGSSVSISGNTAVIGTPNSSAAYVYVRDTNSDWNQQTRLVTENGSVNDRFGSSVSISKDTMIISAAGDDENGIESGSAYVFVRNNFGNWNQQKKLVAYDGSAGDRVGRSNSSVSISGKTVVVGAVGDDDYGSDSGSTYIYDLTNIDTTASCGKGIEFDGANDWINIPNLSLVNDFTVEGWVKLAPGIDNRDALFGQEGRGPDINFYAGKVRLFAAGDKVTANTALLPNTWEHIAITRSGTNLVLYINGVQDATGTWNGTLSLKAIGRGNQGYLKGELDEIRVWDIARTEAEISSSYDTTVDVNSAGLIGYWGLNDTDQIITDASNSGNHGSLGTSTAAGSDDPVRLDSTAPINENCGDSDPVPPVANDDVIDPIEIGETVSFSVIDNDEDADNNIDLSSVEIVLAPNAGDATVNTDGTITYQHTGSIAITDTLTYTVKNTEGLISNEATVTITITQTELDNLPPVVVEDTAIVQAGEVVTIDVLVNDSDSDGTLDKNSLLIVSDPSFGTVNIDFTTGAITYTHDSSATTTDTFTYTVKDNQGAVSGEGATVTISITQDPVASCGKGIEFDGANDWINIPNLSLVNDFTVEGWVKLAPGIDNRDALFGQEGRGPDINFYAGKVRLFAAGDKVTANTALLPNTWEHIAITRSGTNLVLYINGVQDATGTWNGTLSLKAIGRGNRGYLKGELDEIRVWDIARTEAEISSSYDTTVDVNSAGLIGYWGLNDTDQIITDASNSGNHGSLGVSTAAGSDDPVRLDSTAPINENCGDSDPVPPVANDDEIDPIEIRETVSFSVTDNDDDADNNLDLSSVEIVSIPTTGEATVNTDGTITYQHTGSIAITDTLTYTVKNTEGLISNEATVTITITQTELDNLPPVVVEDTAIVQAGEVVTIDVLVNDSDSDGTLDKNSLLIVSDPSFGTVNIDFTTGAITYTHDSSATTTDTFTYTVKDNQGAVSGEGATVTISITQDPVASCGKGIEFDGANDWINIPNLSLANDFTVEGWVKLAPGIDNRDALFGQEGRGPDINFYAGKVRLFAAGDKVTANTALLPNTWEHIAIARSGTNLVLYINGVQDATGTWNGTLSLKAIGRGNRGYLKGELDEIRVWDIARTEAEISSSYDTTVDVNSAGLIGYWGLNDTDQIITDASNSGNHGSLGVSTAAGSDDPVRLDSTAPINENCGDSDPVPPVANDDVIDPIEIGETISFSVTDNDEDADNNIDLSSVEIVSIPTTGEATVNTDGTITYQHTGSIAITDTLTYTVKNSEGLISNEAFVTITVTGPINVPPTANGDTVLVEVGRTINFNVTENDTDADGNLSPTSVVIKTFPINGVATVNPSGTITYSSNTGTIATEDTLTYTVADTAGLVSSEATVTITITQTELDNLPPVVVEDTAIVQAGEVVTIDVLANDRDSDGTLDKSTLLIVNAPSSGTIEIDAEGIITYSHDGTASTTDSFSYTVADNLGDVSSEATVTVSITQDPDVASCGKSMKFDGINDWINIPNLSLANDFTVEGWVKLASGIDNRDALFGQEGRGPDINFYAGKVRLFAAGDKVTANTALLPNTWEHIAITRSGTNLVLYINGVQDATGTWNGTLSLKAIGRGNQGYLKGELDEIRVWDIARTEAEISSSYDTTVDVNSAGLIGYWGLNDTDQIITDTSNSGNHGSLGTSTAAGSDDPVRLDSTAPLEGCDEGNTDGNTNTLSLHGLFSDHGVLQRGVEVPVWGTATAGARVDVNFSGQSKSIIADINGQWMVKLAPLDANATGEIMTVTSGEKTETREDMLVGEVWLASGQSNMSLAMFVADPFNPPASIPSEYVDPSATPSVRVLQMKVGSTSNQPSKTLSDREKWMLSDKEGINYFSAVAYYFGRDLNQALNVPIGIITGTAGGTSVRNWMPGSQIQSNGCNDTATTSVNYNYSIAPLLPYALKGVIWYQGEANTFDQIVDCYHGDFKNLIEGWRKEWAKAANSSVYDFPFYFVQLPNYKAGDRADAWVNIREQMLEVALDTARTEMVVTIDVGDADDVHPRLKLPVGKRLARIARAIDYGEDIVYSGPVYKSIEISGVAAILSFDHIGSGLAAKDNQPLKYFEIAGADGVYVDALAVISGDTVQVTSNSVSAPVKVRYAWHTNPENPNFANLEGLMATPFRTDAAFFNTGGNVAPVANDDAISPLQAGSSISFTVTDNDVDIDGNMNPASVSILSSPSEGTTTVDATGKITYTSTGTVAITDAFSYTVADTQGAISNEATVTITVTGSTAVTFEVMQTLLFDEDKPSNEDFLNNYNMKHLPELGRGQKSYWDIDGGENPFYDPPNELRVKELVGTATASTVFMDLEHLPTNFRDAWDHDGDHTTPTISITDADRDRAIAEMSDIADWVHEADSDLTIGYYGVIPQRDYWSFVDPNRSEELAELQLRNEKFAALAEHVDVLFPSLYTFYNQPENWKVYAKGMIAEAKKYNKPVYAFIWPQYHSGSLGGTFIDGVYWRMQLEELYALGIDGVVIWGGYLQQWDVSALDDDPDNWWYQTLDFMHSKGLLPANTSWSPVN